MKKLYHFLALLGWCTIFLYILDPPSYILGLPSNIFIADLFWIIVIASLFVLLSYNKVKFNKSSEVIYLFLLYLVPILVIPIIGIIIYNYSLNIYLGDARWLQVATILLLLVVVYEKSTSKKFERHVIYFLRLLILTQVPFILLQINLTIFGGGAGLLLDIWYPGGASRYGSYGVHISRFSGSFGAPSALSLITGIVFLISSIRFFIKPDKWDLFFAFLSFVLVIAAGGRTIMFGVPLVLVLLFVIYSIHRLKISRKLIRNSVLVILLAISGGFLLYHFNIGRIATGDRIQSTISLIINFQTFQDVTGRGGARWEQPIVEAFQNYSIIGTLANSSHVLDHLPAFDNYFVFMIAQAGPLILIPYIFLMSYLIICGFKYLIRNNSLGIIIFSISSTIFIYSMTANLLTGTVAKYLLIISILVLYKIDVYRGIKK